MKLQKGKSQLVVLMDPFPPQHQQLVTQNHAPSEGWKADHGDVSTSSHVLMMANESVSLRTQAKTYDTPPDKLANKSASSQLSTTFPPIFNGSFEIQKPISYNVLCPPKGTI
jgi:hypothetical protein